MNRIKCQNCGLVNFESVDTCRRCGQDPRATPVQNLQQPAPPYAPQAPNYASFNGPPQDAAPYGATVAPPPLPYSSPYAQPYSAQYQEPYQTPYQLSYPGRPDTRKQGLAISALVLGIASWALCGIGSIVGLVLGIVATVKATRNPAEYRGKGMAIAGICLNGVYMIVAPIIIAAIAIPNLLAARMAANEAMAISQVRKIGSAEAAYQQTPGNHERYATLEDLIATGLLERDASQKSGYRFTVILASSAARNTTRYDEHAFEVHAVPVNYGSSGKRSFYESADQVIHAADKRGGQADARSPVLQP